MSLAAILGACMLLASPCSGVMANASPAITQATQSPQDSPPANAIQAQPAPTQQPAEPAPENKPAPAPAAPLPTTAQPAQQNPPTSGQPPVTTPPTSNPEVQPGQTPAPPVQPAATEAPSSKKKTAAQVTSHTPSKRARRRRKTKSVAHLGNQATTNAVPKKVVRNGGANDPPEQLSPSLPTQQASNRRQQISQLLSATEANLKKLSGGQTNSSQNDMMDQIRQYTQQAKAAAAAGDLERAHNLAVKARLLSEELVKH